MFALTIDEVMTRLSYDDVDAACGTYDSHAAALAALSTIADHSDLIVQTDRWTGHGTETFASDGKLVENAMGDLVPIWDWDIREIDADLNIQTERPCANCGDECLTLSSRDWCDGCESE